MSRSPPGSKSKAATAPPTADDPLGDAEYKALGEFRRAVREFLAFSEAGAEEQGVSSQQHQALLAIRAHSGLEPMSIRELAKCLMIKHHSAVGLVDRMIERDLIQRQESGSDRRLVLLELRPRGREILQRISVRNLMRLGATGKILSDVLSAVRRLDRQGAWAELEAPATDAPAAAAPRRRRAT